MRKEDSNQTPLMVQVENYAMEFLSQGRAGWDIPHTRAVVYYSGEIAPTVGVDLLVGQTAAWFHDIGYFGLFGHGNSDKRGAIKNRKAQHMIEGARYTKGFLDKPEIARFYQPEQSDRVVHLVSVHDKVPELRDLDELVLMEADTLGAIDLAKVTPTFNYDDAMRYIESVHIRRIPRFMTDLGKKYVSELMPKFEEYFKVQRS